MYYTGNAFESLLNLCCTKAKFKRRTFHVPSQRLQKSNIV